MTEADLLAWADSHCLKGAAATRAAVSQPEEHARCLARLEALWFRWAAREHWARWTPLARAQMEARAVVMERSGVPSREAQRQAFNESLAQRAA